MLADLLIRRARWLCQLSDSTLTWEVRGSNGAEKHVLVFAAGGGSCSARLPVREKPPLPPGYANRLPERQKHFDITTYERLRVVTTELRRLIADGRSIAIRIKPHAVLTHRQLARLLPWV